MAQSAEVTAHLRVLRNPTPWRDRLRAYRVIVDGKRIGVVRPGETAEYAISPGHHTIRLKVGWFGSSNTVGFDVSDGGAVEFVADTGGTAWTSMPDLLKPSSWIRLEQVDM